MDDFLTNTSVTTVAEMLTRGTHTSKCAFLVHTSTIATQVMILLALVKICGTKDPANNTFNPGSYNFQHYGIPDLIKQEINLMTDEKNNFAVCSHKY